MPEYLPDSPPEERRRSVGAGGRCGHVPV